MLDNLANDFAAYMKASLVYFHGNRDFYGLISFLSRRQTFLGKSELE